MTIPTLVSKYRMKILVSQFKKSYATIQNAINITVAENGTPYECYNTGSANYHVNECDVFFNDLFKQLKVIKTCNYEDRDCAQVNYKTKAEVLADGGSVSNTAYSFFDIYKQKIFILSDGSYIIHFAGTAAESHNILFFAIDTNGVKGPNKWGYDLFYMVLNRENMNKDTVVMDEICAMKEKGGYYVSEIMME